MSEWREIAEWDWVEVAGDRDGHLHAVKSITNEDTVDTDWYADGVTTCDMTGMLLIPGPGMRLSAQRCPECCAATGMPTGAQSPKNVDACRPVAEARIAALAPSGR